MQRREEEEPRGETPPSLLLLLFALFRASRSLRELFMLSCFHSSLPSEASSSSSERKEGGSLLRRLLPLLASLIVYSVTAKYQKTRVLNDLTGG